MKKLIFLSLFLLGAFVAVQAQVSYRILNATGQTWTYTVSNGGGQVQVNVPTTGASGTFPDFLVPTFRWEAIGNCTLNGIIAGAPASGSASCGGGGTPTLTYTFDPNGSGPGGAPLYTLTVRIN